MKILGSTLILIGIPLVVIVVSFIIIMPFLLKRLNSVTKKTKTKLDEEKNKIFAKMLLEKRPLSEEESEEYKETNREIMAEFRKEASAAREKDISELGLEDWDKGGKELMDELKTKDMKGFFSLKDLFKK